MSAEPELKYDPAKVNARIAEVEVDIALHEGRASWLRDMADDEDREALRYAGQVDALKKLLTATVPSTTPGGNA